MSVVFSNCMECKRLNYKKLENGNYNYHYWCDAFSDGIPLDFMFRKSQDENEICNNGIKFERDED